MRKFIILLISIILFIIINLCIWYIIYEGNILEENNKKMINLINDNSETLLAITNQKIEKGFRDLDQKITDNNFYLEKIYGDRIDGMFEKLMMMDNR